MSYVSPFNCDNTWLSFEDILRKVYVDGYIRTYGELGAGYCPEFQAVLDYWDSIGATAPSDIDALAYNTWLCGMVDLGVYAKAEFLDLLCTHSQNTALTNWHNPGTFDPSEVLAPTWTQYQGYTGNAGASRYLRSNFIPSVNGTLIGQNNICAIWGEGTDLDESRRIFGGRQTHYLTGIMRNVNVASFYCHANSADTLANLNSKKHYAMSRGVAANYDVYLNLVKTNFARASTGLCDAELYICGYNNGGAAIAANQQLRYLFLFSYLTEVEVNGVINLTETLLDTLGTGLI